METVARHENTGCAAWIYAGGAHHTDYSQNLTAEHLQDFAAIAGIECVKIDKDTKLNSYVVVRWLIVKVFLVVKEVYGLEAATV